MVVLRVFSGRRGSNKPSLILVRFTRLFMPLRPTWMRSEAPKLAICPYITIQLHCVCSGRESTIRTRSSASLSCLALHHWSFSRYGSCYSGPEYLACRRVLTISGSLRRQRIIYHPQNGLNENDQSKRRPRTSGPWYFPLRTDHSVRLSGRYPSLIRLAVSHIVCWV